MKIAGYYVLQMITYRINTVHCEQVEASVCRHEPGAFFSVLRSPHRLVQQEQSLRREESDHYRICSSLWHDQGLSVVKGSHQAAADTRRPVWMSSLQSSTFCSERPLKSTTEGN